MIKMQQVSIENDPNFAAFIAALKYPLSENYFAEYVGDEAHGVVSVAPDDWSAKVTVNRSAAYRRWSDTQKIDLALINNTIATPASREDKDGGCYVPGTLVGADRRATAVKQIDMLVYDLDGSSLADITARIRDAGFLCWIHSTHSHLSIKTLIATNHIERWAKSRGVHYPLSLEDMQRYIADPANRKTYLRNVSYDSAPEALRQTTDGLMAVIAHDPCEKYRLIIPLSQPIVLSRLGTSSATMIAAYKSIYHGVAQTLGLAHDRACEDPSRLYYFASHKPGAADDYVAEIYGGSLDDETVPLLDWTDETRWRRARNEDKSSKASSSSSARDNKASLQGQRKTKSKHLVTTPEGVTVDLMRLRADLNIESILRNALDPSEIGDDRERGGYTVSCPNEHKHSKPGGQGCFTANASDDHASWNLYCSHAGCADDDKFDRLGKLVEDGKVSVDDLGLAPVKDFVLPPCGGCVVPRDHRDSALEQINEQWAVVRVGGKPRYLNIRYDDSIELATKEAFIAHFAAVTYEALGKNGIERRNLGDAWLRWEGRRQYNALGFFPGALPVPDHVYNTYRGFGIEPARGSWKKMLGHIYRVHCHRNPVWLRYYVAWLAQMVQEPEIKMGTAIVVRGGEGTGKNKAGDWFLKMMEPHAMLVSKPEQITGRFNGHLATTLLLYANEAFWAGNKAAEGALKTLLTETKDTTEQKGVDAFASLNYSRIYISSNEDWVVPAGSGGRRFFVLETTDERAQDTEYFKGIDEEMESGGLAAMLHDLQRHDYSAVNLRHVPVTPWLVKQRIHSADNRRRWLREVISEGGFRSHDGVLGDERWTPLALDESTDVDKGVVLSSAKPFFGYERRKATQTDVRRWLEETLDGTTFSAEGPRKAEGNQRYRTYTIPSLRDLTGVWLKLTGETIDVDEQAEGEVDANPLQTYSAAEYKAGILASRKRA